MDKNTPLPGDTWTAWLDDKSGPVKVGSGRGVPDWEALTPSLYAALDAIAPSKKGMDKVRLRVSAVSDYDRNRANNYEIVLERGNHER